MFKNYLLLGWRNLLKNKLAAFINISGLGMAIGCCLVVFMFLAWFYNQDNFHTNRDNIYVIERINEKDEYLGESPAPLGLLLKKDFSHITEMARLDFKSGLLKHNDNVFRESIGFADGTFHKMFDFPIKWGDKSSFADRDGIVLTEELSTKLFGNENPLGKIIPITFNNDSIEYKHNFTIKGVYTKRPPAASFFFNCLIPIENFQSMGINKMDDWNQKVMATFIALRDKKSAIPNKAECNSYLDLYNMANTDEKIKAYHFQSLKLMHDHSYLLGYSIFANTHPLGLVMLSAIAIGILLLVCFNYMNIAIASAGHRLKEIGVRKVLGSERKQIILQFLTENSITCFTGLLLALVLTKLVFLPWFIGITGFDSTYDLLNNRQIYIAIPVLLLIAILGGAAYPALYVSGLKPVAIVKGKLSLNNRNAFRKILLGFQFVITFLGISMSLAFVREQKIYRAKSWGYDPSNKIAVNIADANGKYTLWKERLLADNNNNMVTGSVEAMGRFNTTLNIISEGKVQKVNALHVLGGFISDFKIPILAGRDFHENSENEITTAVVVNQAFLKSNNWSTGIGKSIEYNKNKYTIVGEVKDFYYEPFEKKIEPIVLMACRPSEVKYAYVHSIPQMGSAAHLYLEGIWKKTFSELPYLHVYQDAVFDSYFAGFTQVIQILSAAALLMILVCICGIFGLALLILSKKLKDISIRKILGANGLNVSYQIINEFLIAICFAFIIGTPLSWLFTKSIFDVFAPESVLSFVPFVKTLVGIILLTGISMLWHLYKAFTSNPINALRDV